MNSGISIRELLEKFVQNDCSQEEIKAVVTYFQKATLTDEFPEVEDVLKLLKELSGIEKNKADEIYNTIISVAKEKEKVKPIRSIWRYASVAAVFIGILALGLFYQQNFFNVLDHDVLIPMDEAITLQLENGTLQVIADEGQTQVMDTDGNVVGKQNGNQLVYDPGTEVDRLMYSTLTVPYGKRFEVLLSDGSRAFLNAGTSLKYPVKFIQGESRQVFLNGEAFFDVAKDTERPFIVNADELNVQVFGTQFNVSNYPEDPQIDVVLVEGSVGMYEKGDVDLQKKVMLDPGIKGTFEKGNGTIATKEVVTNIYTSWIKNELVFRNMTFDNILKKLERHYGITIINNNRELGQEEFNASFGDNTIEQVLQSLETTYGIDYTIKDNKVNIQ